MKYALGIDFGGGSSKATLISDSGAVIGSASSEYPTQYPAMGYVEQNPEDWYESAKQNIKSLLLKSCVDLREIACISLDAATHTAVLTDENFQVIRPSIYWTDTRSVDQTAFLKENYGDYIKDVSYHTPGTIWTLPQLMWIRDEEPETFGKIKRIMFAKDYVRHKLTGDFCTDFIEAQGSMLYNMKRGTWDEKLCEICGISLSMLPEIKNPKDIVGQVTKFAAEETGLSEGTPVICGTTDTVMEVFAAGAVEKGNMTLKLATAGRICVVTDQAYPHQNLVNYSHVADGLWYPGTGTKSCAASLRWYRDTFGGDYSCLDEDAEKIDVGCDGLMFHPYLNGELTPHNDPKLCGSFIGIRGGHTKAHFTRAVLEGVAFSMRDCMNALDGLSIPHDVAATAIGGGSKSALWRQIVSDCLCIELRVYETSDSSFGSAMLAGIAAGFWKNEVEALKNCAKMAYVTKPNPKNREKYAQLYKKYQAVYHALKDIYQ